MKAITDLLSNIYYLLFFTTNYQLPTSNCILYSMHIKTNTSRYSDNEIAILFQTCATLLGDLDISEIEVYVRTCRRSEKYRENMKRLRKRFSREKILKSISYYDNEYYRGLYKYGKNVKVTPKIVITAAPNLTLEKYCRIILHELSHHKLHLNYGPKSVGGKRGERMCRESENLAGRALEALAGAETDEFQRHSLLPA